MIGVHPLAVGGDDGERSPDDAIGAISDKQNKSSTTSPFVLQLSSPTLAFLKHFTKTMTLNKAYRLDERSNRCTSWYGD